MDKNDWYKVREIAYASLIGSHSDPKKLPKTKNNFIPLDLEDKKELSTGAILALRKAQLEYNNRNNG